MNPEYAEEKNRAEELSEEVERDARRYPVLPQS